MADAGDAEASLRAGFNLDRIDTEAAVAKLALPVLFASSDPASTASMHDQIKRLHDAKTTGWKRYVEVPDSNHFTVAQNAWPHVREALDETFDEAGRTVGPS